MKSIAAVYNFLQEGIIENLCRYGLLVIILLAFLEVIRRYLFGQTFIWYQDVAVYGNLGLLFLYLGIALRNEAHIRLTLLLEFFRKWGGKYLWWAEMMEVTASGIGVVICGVFVWCGVEFVKVGYDFGKTTDSAELIVWPFYLLLEIGFVFLGIESAVAFYSHWKKLKRVSR